MPLDFSALKTEQDKLILREDNLRKVVFEFREGMLDTLEKLTKEAVSSGLRGCKLLQRVTVDENTIEANFAVNGHNLKWISTADLIDLRSHLGKKEAVLASQIKVFKDEDFLATSPLYIQITISESGTRFEMSGRLDHYEYGMTVSRQDGSSLAERILEKLLKGPQKESSAPKPSMWLHRMIASDRSNRKDANVHGWEYMHIEDSGNTLGDVLLNEIGANGWELAGVGGSHGEELYFKRPLQN